MLHAEECDLVEGLSRLCVMRTEDYQLLKSIRKTQRIKPDKEYLRFILADFRKREQWRCDREVTLLSQLGGWEHTYYTETRWSDKQMWESLGAFDQVYLGCIRTTYNLQDQDLVDTPFTNLESSKGLYYGSGSSPSLRGFEEVYDMFRSKERDSKTPPGGQVAALVDILYPLQREGSSALDALDGREFPAAQSLQENDPSTMKEDLVNKHIRPAIRAALRASLKVWQVLFLLWKHLLIRCPTEEMSMVEIDWSRTLSTTAGAFLSSQKCRFVSMLEATDSMHSFE